MVTKATKAATPVRKPISTFIPVTAPLVVVGVVLVSELVVDADAVFEVTAVVASKVEEELVLVLDPDEEDAANKLNSPD